jgi:ferredoxin
VFALELIERRFWCRNLCPSGALLGFLSRFSLLQRLPGRVCTKCKAQTSCSDTCRMGAFDEQAQLLKESCNLCMDCVKNCPVGAARFQFKVSNAAPVPFEPSRRLFIASMATGVVLPVAARSAGIEHRCPDDLIRPPGARSEREFLDLCVRCGECMKVCTTNALQPTLFESGIAGTFSPRLTARMGYCEYNCTLCSQVCPTGAIKLLPLKEKQKFVMGLAVFNKDVCLPFAKGESCITCEEHCPLPEKAIRFKNAEVVKKTGERVIVKQPFTVLNSCIG